MFLAPRMPRLGKSMPLASCTLPVTQAVAVCIPQSIHALTPGTLPSLLTFCSASDGITLVPGFFIPPYPSITPTISCPCTSAHHCPMSPLNPFPQNCLRFPTCLPPNFSPPGGLWVHVRSRVLRAPSVLLLRAGSCSHCLEQQPTYSC